MPVSKKMNIRMHKNCSWQLRQLLFYHLPFVSKNNNENLVRLNHKEARKRGFWRRLTFNGSASPASKINSNLLVNEINGQQVLMIFGGTNINVGSTKFEQNHANMDNQKWKKIEYDGTKFGEIDKKFTLPQGAKMVAR